MICSNCGRSVGSVNKEQECPECSALSTTAPKPPTALERFITVCKSNLEGIRNNYKNCSSQHEIDELDIALDREKMGLDLALAIQATMQEGK